MKARGLVTTSWYASLAAVGAGQEEGDLCPDSKLGESKPKAVLQLQTLCQALLNSETEL